MESIPPPTFWQRGPQGKRLPTMLALAFSTMLRASAATMYPDFTFRSVTWRTAET
jgi:hypothetical protein